MRARVPRYLHLPLQVLWFDMEDIGVILVMYVFWLMIDHWSGLVLLVLVPRLFMSVKANKPRGFLRHILYRYGFAKLKDYPSPQTRVFHE